MQSNFIRRGKGRAQGVPDVAPPERPPKDPVNIPIETPVLAPAASKGTVVGSRRSLLHILRVRGHSQVQSGRPVISWHILWEQANKPGWKKKHTEVRHQKHKHQKTLEPYNFGTKPEAEDGPITCQSGTLF